MRKHQNHHHTSLFESYTNFTSKLDHLGHHLDEDIPLAGGAMNPASQMAFWSRLISVDPVPLKLCEKVTCMLTYMCC